jgi:hypothetical protein
MTLTQEIEDLVRIHSLFIFLNSTILFEGLEEFLFINEAMWSDLGHSIRLRRTCTPSYSDSSVHILRQGMNLSPAQTYCNHTSIFRVNRACREKLFFYHLQDMTVKLNLFLGDFTNYLSTHYDSRYSSLPINHASPIFKMPYAPTIIDFPGS